ncbi:protein FAR-RED IMPAIRED RESPONSE 1-like [Lolium rigidum]|uniref:protein FAR-RED IMPAIRED RESPONSE 1-like n=1 Tax=Lolium rigidum TaxID=89674 RepID=UPI001F5D5021|nr:protein FAR-RED IMPAIRED RESPONSE 1-like [Lolium rigidum]
MQNYYRDFKEIIRDADAQTIIDAMESKQKINPTFFFRYELDDENKLTHIFWADGTSRKNYALFGNVLSFDSTYRTNRYDLVFAPFTGINHHKDCVTFGGSFLCHEKIGSYRWLFKAFLEAMGGVAPTLIITDEDKSMKAAIEEVLPNTVHRLCMWHILNKVPEKVGRELNKNEDFQREFSICVWASETPDEFEEKWSSVISDFGLQDNEWLAAKYEIRQSWIPAYFRGVFLSGLLRTTSRSESENAFFGHFIHRRLSLLEFWIRYETAIEEQRQKELEHDNASLHTLPVLVTTWSIENHAREVYTHTVFMLFQAQVVAAMEKCDVRKIEQVGEVQTTCISHGKGRIREVVFNSSKKDVQCSCKLFESVGIPCSHMIVVLKREQFSEIPSHYVLDRWKKTANQKVVLDANGNVLQGTSRTLPPVIDQMYSDTYCKFNMGMMAAKHCEEKMQYLHKGINDLIDHVLHMGPASERTKVQEFESFIGVKIPSEINIHPPAIAHTKGNGKRFKKSSEKGTSGKKKRRSASSQKG